MSDGLFVAGDLSGIQDYVLSVSMLGGGQARRLRARSFFVQVVEEIAARAVLDGFGARWDDAVLLRGGGQFLIRLPDSPRAEERLRGIREELGSKLHREARGGLGLALAWGRSVEQALRSRDREKRCPWASQLTGSDGWRSEALSLESLTDRPCQICGRQPATRTWREDGEEIRVCARCNDDTEIGRKLPTAGYLALCPDGGDFQVLGRDLRFSPAGPAGESQTLRAPRLHVPADMTFKAIADKALGDNLLAVLKADVDSMGAKLAEIRQRDPGYGALRKFSRDLDDFFSHHVQEALGQDRWQCIYTIYSGGDDLLLVGPWNVVLDFAEAIHRDFSAGPGKRYGLTFSAGVALTSYRVPIRHGVEQADDLLEQAKGRRRPAPERRELNSSNPAAIPPDSGKDRCAALGWVWKWERHSQVLSGARQIKEWIDRGVCGRAMIHRLLSLADQQDPLRTAHWAYEVGRNFPKPPDARPEAREFRAWGERVLAEILENPGAARELAVQLRYALTATRAPKEKP